MEGDSESGSSSSANREYKVTVYDFKGKKQGGYRETLPAHENVVEEDKKLPTAEEHRAYFKDQDFSDASRDRKIQQRRLHHSDQAQARQFHQRSQGGHEQHLLWMPVFGEEL